MASDKSTVSPAKAVLVRPPPACQAAVDKLIDWYEQNKPDAGQQIKVKVCRRTAMRFAKSKARGGPLFYRGRELVPRVPPKDSE